MEFVCLVGITCQQKAFQPKLHFSANVLRTESDQVHAKAIPIHNAARQSLCKSVTLKPMNSEEKPCPEKRMPFLETEKNRSKGQLSSALRHFRMVI